MRKRSILSKFRGIIGFLVAAIRILPLSIRVFFFYRLRSVGGYLGLILRYILLKTIAEECGENVSIFQNCYILNPRKLKIGSNVSIHPLCYIDASGGISIGNDVSIAHNVTIMSSTHMYDEYNSNIKDQTVILKPTHISNNVWVGAKSIVLAGRTIDSGSIIGAASVVTKDIIADTINAGNPSSIIKSRIQT